MIKNVLIIICSRNPNSILHMCVESLLKYQTFIKDNDMDDIFNYKIIIVDSNSTNKDGYNLIKNKYKDIEIYFAKNINYEIGAYKIGFNLYPNFDFYYCIQDSIILKKKIDMSLVNDTTVFIPQRITGFWTTKMCQGNLSEQELKHELWDSNRTINRIKNKLLLNCKLPYQDLIDKRFCLCLHNTFVVTKKIIVDIFDTFDILPTSKRQSCAYERLLGMYFILKKIKTIEAMGTHFNKIHCKRK